MKLRCALVLLSGLLLASSCLPMFAASDGATLETEPKNEAGRVSMIAQDGCLRSSAQGDAPCVSNPQGCTSITIETDPVTGDTCEVCYGVAGNVLEQHCGASQEAVCARSEDPAGATCTICQTTDGTIVFDSCHQQPTDIYSCERFVDADNQQCSICYDASGTVVSRDCAPAGYTCAEFIEGNQVCKRCYDQSNLVSETCSGSTTDPTSCSVIDDQTGYRCYTCTDSSGVVVDHNCSSTTAIRCETYYSQDGTLCETCYDNNGAVSSQQCSPAPPPDTCREYRSEINICLICLDANNNITRRECYVPCAGTAVDQRCGNDNECTGGMVCTSGVCTCPPSPPCDLFMTTNGVLCEICGDRNNDGLVDELDANCFETPTDPVRCWEEQRTDANGGAVICRVCESATAGRTEECSQNPAPPLTCEVVSTTGGQNCEVCRDPSGQVAYTTCQDLVCSETAVQPILADSTNAALVACQICNRGELMASLACDMAAVCPASTGVAPPDPTVSSRVDACGNLWVSMEPLQCASNPWQRWWQELYPNESQPVAQREGELIRAYYVSTQQPPIKILAYRVEHAYDTATCSSCQCTRGDVIYLYVTAADAERLTMLGWRQAQ